MLGGGPAPPNNAFQENAVFAPQCLSTLAVVRRETNSWRYPAVMAAYLFGLAYAASFVTYRVTLWLGG